MGRLFSDPRVLVLAAIPAVLFLALLAVGPIPQRLAYHAFADKRAFMGIPAFGNVASNLAFLASGALGLRLCIGARPPGARGAWSVFFAAMIAVTFGSAWYHLGPDNARLVWDRLPMSVAFTAAYVALVAEYVDAGGERRLLLPASAAGVASVAWWAAVDDLVPYFAMQGSVFLSGLWLLIAFRKERADKAYLSLAFACYGAAIAVEHLDPEIFALSGEAVSGHTLKHLFAALAPFWLYRMLARRGGS